MEDKKTYVRGIIPFIVNIGHKGDPNVKEINENVNLGLKDVMGCTGINVNVEAAEELTPEAQQEILNEEY